MKYKYLYIDDVVGSETVAFLHGFNNYGIIEIQPLSFDRGCSFEAISKLIASKVNDDTYAGVLLDLCLDGTGSSQLNYKAPPLAQQIRTLASEGKMPHIPIVLCSTLKFKKFYYDKDHASHDLFDFVFDKTTVDYFAVSNVLESLAQGYSYLQLGGRTISDILQRGEVDLSGNSILNVIPNCKDSSPFVFANSFIKEVINYCGILVDEWGLAARLGIDIDASGKNWTYFLNKVDEKLKYNGIFGSGWTRYWADRIDQFFSEIANGTLYQLLTAKERVDYLTKAGFEGLVAASPIEYNKSSYFNTYCAHYHKAIDSNEGIPLIDTSLLKVWQEPQYVSFLAIASGDYCEPLCKEGQNKLQLLKQRIASVDE